MEDIQAIDTMCRPFYAKSGLLKEYFEMPEMREVTKTTFAGVAKRMGVKAGEEWKVFAGTGHATVAEMVQEMDEVGVEYVMMDQVLQFSRRDLKTYKVMEIEELAEMVKESGGRIVPGIGYDPLRIEESLRTIEVAVKEYNFKYVWFHPMTFGLKPVDQKCYPLYAKCNELNIPVSFQTGHSAEPLPSEFGHPMLADEIALDFPNLIIILTHTGWPWTEEWCSMLWRHSNVYGNIGAYFPSFFPERQVEFIDRRLRRKVLWATNGLGFTRHKKEFLELPLRDETKRHVLRDNAFEVFDLN